MAASSRAQVLDLYRAMLRESKHFSAYNYRTYAVRRIRDAFRENKNVKDPVEIQALVNKAKRDLEIIRRQLSLEPFTWSLIGTSSPHITTAFLSREQLPPKAPRFRWWTLRNSSCVNCVRGPSVRNTAEEHAAESPVFLF
uniref:LYR motif containing 4 n=1 Tax=Equus asinus TaxID=9793 RepID=A0A9L0JCW0_EQUAS